MKYLYLKAATEQDLINALPFARKDDQWLEATSEFALDIIGDIYNDDAVFKGRECITPATKIPGFHANLILINEDLVVPEEIIITPSPSKLQRVWA